MDTLWLKTCTLHQDSNPQAQPFPLPDVYMVGVGVLLLSWVDRYTYMFDIAPHKGGGDIKGQPTSLQLCLPAQDREF